MDVINSLLRSRKFWLALFGVIQTLVFHYFSVEPEIWEAINVFVLFLISAIAVEDAALKFNSTRNDNNVWTIKD